MSEKYYKTKIDQSPLYIRFVPDYPSPRMTPHMVTAAGRLHSFSSLLDSVWEGAAAAVRMEGLWGLHHHHYLR